MCPSIKDGELAVRNDAVGAPSVALGSVGDDELLRMVRSEVIVSIAEVRELYDILFRDGQSNQEV